MKKTIQSTGLGYDSICKVEINRESISTEIEVPFNVIIPNSYNYVHKES